MPKRYPYGPTQEQIDEFGDTALQLHDYIAFRAAHEGVGYDLGPGWFLAALTKGCTGFFGIEVGPHGIIKDEQNPDAFAAWRRKHAYPVDTQD